jgi:hypothetical protein
MPVAVNVQALGPVSKPRADAQSMQWEVRRSTSEPGHQELGTTLWYTCIEYLLGVKLFS